MLRQGEPQHNPSPWLIQRGETQQRRNWFFLLHHHWSYRGLQTSSKDGKNEAIETTPERGGAGGWLKAVQAINSNSICLPSNKFLNICLFPITLLLNSASRQAKRSNGNFSAPLLTSRKDQDKLFIFLLFPFAFVIYIPIYLAELPPLLVNFWIITWGCRWNSNNRKENKNWNELGEEEVFNLKK